MATILIRKLDERTKASLRIRAAQNNRSMEDEARTILREALSRQHVPAGDLASSIRAKFQRVGGVELELPPREPMRKPPRPGR